MTRGQDTRELRCWKAGCLALAVCLTLLASEGSPVSAQTLCADYRLENTLASTDGKAPALAPLGDNAFAREEVGGAVRPALRFPKGSGLAITPATAVVAGDAYTIIIEFRFDETESWRRIIDFRNATTDEGLYSKDGRLEFYSIAIGKEVVIKPNTWVQVMLTRNRFGKVVGYVDGKPQFAFTDTEKRALPDAANTLRFFRDDGDEQSAGAVARIRIYGGALTTARNVRRPSGHRAGPALVGMALAVQGELRFQQVAEGGLVAGRHALRLRHGSGGVGLGTRARPLGRPPTGDDRGEGTSGVCIPGGSIAHGWRDR